MADAPAAAPAASTLAVAAEDDDDAAVAVAVPATPGPRSSYQDRPLPRRPGPTHRGRFTGWVLMTLLTLYLGSLQGSSATLLSDTSWAADCQKFSLSDKIEVGWEDAGNLVELHIRHNVQVSQ